MSPERFVAPEIAVAGSSMLLSPDPASAPESPPITKSLAVEIRPLFTNNKIHIVEIRLHNIYFLWCFLM